MAETTMTPEEARARLAALVGRLVLVRETNGGDTRTAVGRLERLDDAYRLDAPTVRMPDTSLTLDPTRIVEVTTDLGDTEDALRARLAAALYTAPADPTDAAERVARRTADRDAAAVLGVVAAEASRIALGLTGGYEVLYRQHQGDLLDAENRIADLEEQLAATRTEPRP